MLVGTDPRFPLGRRGQRPLKVAIPAHLGKSVERLLPGVSYTKGYLSFSWECLPAAVSVLGVDTSGLPPLDFSGVELAGLEEYERLFKDRLRGYQKGMVQFLALRAYAINGDPMRSGKTPTTLAAASLIGAKKVLIMCPSIAKMVWATELVKWMQQPSVILSGRAGEEARVFCVTCNGTGRDSDQKYCYACRAKNGQSYGYRIINDQAEAIEAIASNRFTIANYDILTPQMKRNEAGVRSERLDLQGWHKILGNAKFDLCIGDEGHILRGRSKRDRAGESRRDKMVEICRFIERVWLLTGTPIFGRVADLWAMVDVLTDGLFGRPFFAFDARYCNGHKGEYGWVNDGMMNADELKSRLDVFMLKRDRKEILPELPPKTRQLVRIDASKATFQKPKKTGLTGLHAALRVTAGIKEPIVAEAVLNECAEGAKVVVFTYLRENAEGLAAAIGKGAEKDPRLKARNMRIWATNGDVSTDARFKQAQAFREWPGAACFVATIDSVPVAISLKGAQSVHFADLVFDPASLLQAEDRPYEVGTNGLAIVYYVVEKTVDEHVVELVLPKMEMMERVMSESAATDFTAALRGNVSPEAMAEEIWARMISGIGGGES